MARASRDARTSLRARPSRLPAHSSASAAAGRVAITRRERNAGQITGTHVKAGSANSQPEPDSLKGKRTMSATKRPTTCSAIAALDPTLGQAGCKRLPRHGGDHRVTLTIAAGRRAERAATAKPKASKVTGRKLTVATIKQVVSDIRVIVGVEGKRRMNATQRRLAFVELDKLVASGKVTVGNALGVAAKLA